MSTTPAVTVGISFRNPGVHFRGALQSVFAQTFEDWELILIDDGSTDGSLELARALKDPRVRVVGDGMQRGLAPRLNQLTKLASAPYFFRMDADDIMHPRRLELQYEELLRGKENTVLATGAYSIDGHSRVVGQKGSEILPAVLHRNYRISMIHPTVAAATGWFRRHPYSEELVFRRSEDAELWNRTREHTGFAVLPIPLFYYREVGCLSYENYVATSVGLLCLACRQRRASRLMALANVCVESGKVWVVSALQVFGKLEWLSKGRYRALPAETKASAEDDLAAVFRQPLPI